MGTPHVRVPDDIFDSPIFEHPPLFKLYCFCLRRASWSKKPMSWGKGLGVIAVNLLPGQCIYGGRSWAKALNMDDRTVDRMLKTLEKMGKIERKVTRQYSVISVIDSPHWGTEGVAPDAPFDAPLTHQRRTIDAPLTPYKEGKKERSEEGKKESKPSGATKPRNGHLFIPPTLDEVKAYAATRPTRTVDPCKFHEFYEAGNPPWTDSKGNPVKSWKQKFLTWEKNPSQIRHDRDSQALRPGTNPNTLDAVGARVLARIRAQEEKQSDERGCQPVDFEALRPLSLRAPRRDDSAGVDGGTEPPILEGEIIGR